MKIYFNWNIIVSEINNKYLQGRVKVPTGGIAREQFLQIRCNSEADSKVWMKEVIDGLSCVMNIARDADMWMIHGEPELIGYQL